MSTPHAEAAGPPLSRWGTVRQWLQRARPAPFLEPAPEYRPDDVGVDGMTDLMDRTIERRLRRDATTVYR